MNKLTTLGFSALSIAALAAGCGPSNGDDAQGQGGKACAVYPCFTGGDVSGEKNFANLINKYTRAALNPTPWAGWWWAYSSNGIAKDTGGGSPASKYDAARGLKDGAQKWEIAHHGSAQKPAGWEGHCNGWTAAAGLIPEPKHDVKVNGVTFTVADQKALLAETGMEASVDFFGNRVDYAVTETSPKYLDVIPDMFFLLVTNYIGKHNIPLNIDRYTLDQVWNQPMVAYSVDYPKPSDYLGEDPSAKGVYRINVTATMWWAEDGVGEAVSTPQFKFEDVTTDSYGNPFSNDFGYEEGDTGHNSPETVFSPRILKMELWLDGPVVFDSNGKITSSGNVIVTRQQGTDYFVGGAWKMGGFSADNWPDYMWVPYSFQPETQNYQNPFVDINWLRQHLFNPQYPNGLDDPTASPVPVTPAPSVTPTPSSNPTPAPHPTPTPTPHPTPSPVPWPSVWPSILPNAV